VVLGDDGYGAETYRQDFEMHPASSLVVTLVFMANNAMTQPLKSRSSSPNS
jgi:hypothetical protein